MKQVFELQFKIFLLRDIHLSEVPSVVTGFIDEVLAKDKQCLEMHNQSTYKPYVHDWFHPVEKNEIYIKGHIYQIRIRTLSKELADYFLAMLAHHETKYMKGLTCQIKIIRKRPIEKTYSITPVLIRLENGGYWKNKLPFEEFEEQLKVNLIKKYNYFFDKKIDENFALYKSIQLINRTPISVAYKNVHFLCDKLEIYAADNPRAQELLFMSLAVGIGTSNSRGFGMMNYKFI